MKSRVNVDSEVSIKELVESSVEIGRLTYMSFDKAIVATNDSKVDEADGVPRNSFLLAVKDTDDDIDQAILLSVENITNLEATRETQYLKESLANNNSKPDPTTLSLLTILGFSCRIVGSFYVSEGKLNFGADLDRVYAYSSYRVYKPKGKSLSLIASYNRPNYTGGPRQAIKIGNVRYTETQNVVDEDAEVFVDVRDFVGKKTAVFGMTRTGKALTENTRIPVPVSDKFPNGWALNKELEINDVIYSGDGNLTRIVSFTDWRTEPTLVLSFSDGQSVETCFNHLWKVTLDEGIKIPVPDENYDIAKFDERLKDIPVGTYASLDSISDIFKIPSDFLERVSIESGITKHLLYTLNSGGVLSHHYPIKELMNFFVSILDNDGVLKYRILSSSEVKSLYDSGGSVSVESGFVGDSVDSFNVSDKDLSKFLTFYYRDNESFYSELLRTDYSTRVRALDFLMSRFGYLLNDGLHKIVLADGAGYDFCRELILSLGYVLVSSVGNELVYRSEIDGLNSVVSVVEGSESVTRCLTVDSWDSTFLVEDFVRTHNSNSLKILVQQVFEYSKLVGQPIGQIIFDPQGEYANVNVQDKGALSNLGDGKDVAIYKTTGVYDSGDRVKPLLLNFLDEDNAQLAWDFMVSELYSGASAKANYISGVRTMSFVKPSRTADISEKRRYARRRLGLYALMNLAYLNGTIKAFYLSIGKDNIEYVSGFEGVEIQETSPSDVKITSTRAAKKVFEWLLSNQEKLTESWQESFKEGDMAFFAEQWQAYQEGKKGVTSAFIRIKELHSDKSSGDLRETVWEDLVKGRLVIIDLSKGSRIVTKILSELIVNSIVDHASDRFTSGLEMSPIQIVVEEAHNLFTRNSGKDEDIDPWVRLSKEAAKYNIGLIYATQEISGVDQQILSNTSNWIIAHLNSRKETSELDSYYSFSDWGEHLRSTESKGFVRLKTESSPYIVPVQISKFEPK